MATRKILCKEEKILMKLESILDLYKNFHEAANEEDKLVILEALEDIREILTRSYINERLKRKEVTEIEDVLKDLKSHVKAMAIDELFSEIDEVKIRMDLVEKRFEVEDTMKHPKNYFNEEDEDEIWSRISAKRKEILGQSSLRLRALLPRHKYKVRFDLRGLPAPTQTGSQTENEKESSQEKPKEIVKSTDQLLRDRADSIQRFLTQRRTRLREARRRTKISSALVNSVDFSIQRSTLGLQRARDARCGKFNTVTTPELTHGVDEVDQGKPNSDTIARCEECQKLLKERDKFWGLESDSEEEDIKEFNKHVTRRSMRRDSRSFESPQRKGVGTISGRGTWTTTAIVPPWAVKSSSQMDSSVLQEGRLGQMQGTLKKFFSRLTRHRRPLRPLRTSRESHENSNVF